MRTCQKKRKNCHKTTKTIIKKWISSLSTKSLRVLTKFLCFGVCKRENPQHVTTIPVSGITLYMDLARVGVLPRDPMLSIYILPFHCVSKTARVCLLCNFRDAYIINHRFEFPCPCLVHRFPNISVLLLQIPIYII
jgi:hypothetical protein